MINTSFENTTRTMSQLAHMLGNSIDDNEPLDLSHSEKDYFDNMRSCANELIEFLDQYNEHFPEAEE